MKPNRKPRVLCVDDEPFILEGLTLQLRKLCEVATANGGEAGLQLLEKDRDFAVIVSDMRMPGIDGATFLSRAKVLAPDATRMLLTGHSDIDSAIMAINEGQIFRFLTKPCPTDVLHQAFASAVEQHRLVTSERVLLQETLNGSIRALTEVLSLVSPTAFGRAARIKQKACELATAVRATNVWEIEIAAMLSQLACVTLPAPLTEKLYKGQSLSESERAQADRIPSVSAQLLSHIPRLESILEILTSLERTSGPVSTGALILKLSMDYDTLEAQRLPPSLAMETLRGRGRRYAPELLDALATLLGAERTTQVLELPLQNVRPGMVFVEDVHGPDGLLLIARGHQVTLGLLERLRNLSADMRSRITKVTEAKAPDPSPPAGRAS